MGAQKRVSNELESLAGRVSGLTHETDSWSPWSESSSVVSGWAWNRLCLDALVPVWEAGNDDTDPWTSHVT